MVILFGGQSIWGFEYDLNENLYDGNVPTEKAHHYTILFNTFVMMQVFNEINCRKINPDELNVFAGFFNNYFFLGIISFSVIVQILLVEVGGPIVKVVPLSITEHLTCVIIGALCIPYGNKIYLNL